MSGRRVLTARPRLMAMLVWLSLLSQLQTAVGHFVQLYRRIHKAAQEERQADTRR